MSKPSLQAIPFNPWIYFFIFLAANALLSYFHLSLEMKLWIILVGLLLPGAVALLSLPPSGRKENRFAALEGFPLPPPWAWVLLACAALFIRFYKLTTLSGWPLYDEGFIGYYALELSQKWDWRFLYGSSQAPPLFIWILGFLFKAFGPSLQVLWFLPAFLSALSVPLGYLAARLFFTKPFSFFCAVFLGLGFWAFYIGRFSQMPMMVLPAECLALAGVGFFIRASRPAVRKKILAALGFLLAAGFYIHTSWAAVAGAIGLTLLFLLRREKSLIPFLALPFVLVLSPLALAAAREGYGLYVKDLWAFNDGQGIFRQLSVSMGYLREIFWGFDPGEFSPELVGGGLWNPLGGALFFLGLLDLIRNFRRPPAGWLLAVSTLFLLPGILTRTLEIFRILPLLPLLIVISVAGLARLIRSVPRARQGFFAALLLFPSAGLDFYHLLGAYQGVWNQPVHWKDSLKSLERCRADEILRAVRQKWGPGFVFSDFVPGYSDQTLDLTTYSYNAAQNQNLSPEKASWAAVLINVNYQESLTRLFPRGKGFWLSPDLSVPDGGMMLWVTPLEPSQREIINRWRSASLSLKPFIRQSLAYVHGGPWRPVLDSLLKVEPFFQGDAFLRAVYWEKVGDTSFRLGGKTSEAVQSLQKALERGIRAAHLYHRLGTLYWVSGEKEKALSAFRAAALIPHQHTDASAFRAGSGKTP